MEKQGKSGTLKTIAKSISLFLLGIIILFTAWSYDGSLKYLYKDMIWGFFDVIEFYLVHVKLPFKKIHASSPEKVADITIENNVPITMRDGTTLRANVFHPQGSGKFPAIMIREPYGKDGSYIYMPAVGKHFAHRGYAVITQDVRGKWASDGKFEPMIHEINDGYDTIEWIIRQPWSDGTVGAFGESYFSYTSMAAAASMHPALKSYSPSTMDPDPFRATFRGGAFQMQAMGYWCIYMDCKTEQNELRINPWHLPLISLADTCDISSRFYTFLISNPTRNQTSEAFNLNPKLNGVQIPALHFAGWYDNFLGASISNWQERHTRYPDRNFLIIGPWDHEYSSRENGRIGKIFIGYDAKDTYYDELEAFFDRYLKGETRAFQNRPAVKIFVMGDNVWRDENEWPLARTHYVKYYLNSSGHANTAKGDGYLSTDIPETQGTDNYIYDPENPVQLATEQSQWDIQKQMTTRESVQKRPDVLVYTGEPLTADMEVTGPIIMTLFASTSAKDTDFTATLVDVYPDGHTQLIQDGIVRMRYLNSDTREELLVPGKIYAITIDMWATSNVFKKGHRIQVEVSSSNFDKFDRNLNTGETFGRSTAMIAAKQTIYHSKAYPSHITLPVIPR